MRKAYVLLFLVCFVACQYHDTSIQDPLHTNFSEAQGKAITVGEPSFQVIVLTIVDSRCPMDAYCIWGGEASVTFQIGSVEFSLKIGESKDFSVGQKNYKLTLINVTPFPSSKNANDQKKAVFTLEVL